MDRISLRTTDAPLDSAQGKAAGVGETAGPVSGSMVLCDVLTGGTS